MSDQRCPGSPGDIIVFPRRAYNHLAVNVGNGDIVHVTSISDNPGSLDVAGICFCSTSDRIAEIKKEKYSDFKQPGDKPYVETSWKGKTPLESSKIVRRALSEVGRKGYSVLKKNCEHFARWCRYDEKVSDQADGLVTAGKAVAAGTALAIAGYVALNRREDERQHRQ